MAEEEGKEMMCESKAAHQHGLVECEIEEDEHEKLEGKNLHEANCEQCQDGVIRWVE